MDTAPLLNADATGLGSIAKALSALDGVESVRLSLLGGRRYLLFALISQERIDAHRVSPAPRESALALTLRIADYAGNEPFFVMGLDGPAARMLRVGRARVWPFAEVPPQVAPYKFNLATGLFMG